MKSSNSETKAPDEEKQRAIQLNLIAARQMSAQAQLATLLAVRARPPIPSASSAAAMDATTQQETVQNDRVIAAALASDLADLKDAAPGSAAVQPMRPQHLPITITTSWLNFPRERIALFKRLPNAIMWYLFLFLERKDLAKLAQVNISLAELTHQEQTVLTQYKQQKWNEAVHSKSAENIMQMLKSGIAPKDLKTSIAVTSQLFSEVKTTSVSAIKLAIDDGSFDIADKLLARGALLPQPRKEQSECKELRELIYDEKDLYIFSRSNPEIVNQKGEYGETLLHHCASLGIVRGTKHAYAVLRVVFTTPNLDFTATDNEGNTALHVCAKRSDHFRVCEVVFPAFM